MFLLQEFFAKLLTVQIKQWDFHLLISQTSAPYYHYIKGNDLPFKMKYL